MSRYVTAKIAMAMISFCAAVMGSGAPYATARRPRGQAQSGRGASLQANWSAGVLKRWAAATPHHSITPPLQHSSTPMDIEPRDGSKLGNPWVFLFRNKLDFLRTVCQWSSLCDAKRTWQHFSKSLFENYSPAPREGARPTVNIGNCDALQARCPHRAGFQTRSN